MGIQVRRAAAAGALALVFLASGLTVEGGGGKVAPPPKSKPPPPPPLAVGCLRLADGRDASLSLDGKYLAFARMGFDAKRTDRAGDPLAIPETWVRDLGSKKEWKLPQETMPRGWTAGPTLLLETGAAVDPVKGASVAGIPSLPQGTEPAAMAWSRDGKRLAYVPRLSLRDKTQVYVVSEASKMQPLSGTNGMRTDQAVVLAWAPDGSRLFVNALFQPDEGEARRRVGVVDPATGEMKVVAELPDWIDIPGLRGGSRASRFFMEPGRRRGEGNDAYWNRPTGPRYGAEVWDAAGKLFAYVQGSGWSEADVYVADTTGATTWRLTVDGETKWSPSLDGPGRRVAFLTADEIRDFKGRRIRVIDLLTGDTKDYPLTGTDGVPGALAWSSDGSQVVYEIQGGAAGGVYAQAVAAPKPAPEGAQIQAKEYVEKERVLSWLAAKSADRVHDAVHRAGAGWDPEYVPAIRKALSTWSPTSEEFSSCILRVVGQHQVKEAIPEVRAALTSKRGRTQVFASRVLLLLQAKDALPDLDKLRTSGTAMDVRTAAAGAMVGMGDARGWADLAKAATEVGVRIRLDLCAALALVHDPKSIDMLIPLVEDKEKLGYSSFADRHTLGEAAQLVLEAHTSQNLGGDKAAWTTWWKGEANRALPEGVGEREELKALLWED